MAEIIKWSPECIWCGKSSGGSCTTANGRSPMSTPRMSGKCPSSPNGNHAPKWKANSK